MRPIGMADVGSIPGNRSSASGSAYEVKLAFQVRIGGELAWLFGRHYGGFGFSDHLSGFSSQVIATPRWSDRVYVKVFLSSWNFFPGSEGTSSMFSGLSL